MSEPYLIDFPIENPANGESVRIQTNNIMELAGIVADAVNNLFVDLTPQERMQVLGYIMKMAQPVVNTVITTQEACERAMETSRLELKMLKQTAMTENKEIDKLMREAMLQKYDEIRAKNNKKDDNNKPAESA